MSTHATDHGDSRNSGAVGGYAAINGLNLYYEISGTGDPLIMLAGGFGTMDVMFGDLVRSLAANRQVISVDLQGHGRTADIDRPLSYELMADDIAALMQHIGLERVDIFGYSLGGGVALQTTIRHPGLVRKLVVVSAPGKRIGWYPEDLAGMDTITAEAGKTWEGSPMHQAYARIAPHPEQWPTLVGKMGQLLKQNYDWSESIRRITAPTLVVVGDADGVRLTHAVELFGLLGGKNDSVADANASAQLSVLPGTTHLSMMYRGDFLAAIIPPFLDASPSDSEES